MQVQGYTTGIPTWTNKQNMSILKRNGNTAQVKKVLINMEYEYDLLDIRTRNYEMETDKYGVLAWI